MPKYKVTKVFVLAAASKQEALTQVVQNTDETLEFLSISEQAPERSNGWLQTAKHQVTGK